MFLSGKCKPHSLKQRKRNPHRLNGLGVLPLQHTHTFCNLKYWSENRDFQLLCAEWAMRESNGGIVGAFLTILSWGSQRKASYWSGPLSTEVSLNLAMEMRSPNIKYFTARATGTSVSPGLRTDQMCLCISHPVGPPHWHSWLRVSVHCYWKDTAFWLLHSHPTAALGEAVEGYNSTVQHPSHTRTAGSSLLLSLETPTITLGSYLICGYPPTYQSSVKFQIKNKFNLNQEKNAILSRTQFPVFIT